MRAIVWHGKEDVRCDRVTDPEIEHPRDAIIKVTSCAICGSDLHLFHNFIPAMMPGDIMGHEMMGEVVEVGSGVNGHLKKGDRIVVPFTITCGECEQCRRGNWSVCERTNRKKELADKVFGHSTGGLFGYTHLTGGYRAFGAREIASGVTTLSTEKETGLWSRLAGDALDLAVLSRGLSPYNPQRQNVKWAMLAVAGVTALDALAASAVTARKRRAAIPESYADRSGFPKGLKEARRRPVSADRMAAGVRT